MTAPRPLSALIAQGVLEGPLEAGRAGILRTVHRSNQRHPFLIGSFVVVALHGLGHASPKVESVGGGLCLHRRQQRHIARAEDRFDRDRLVGQAGQQIAEHESLLII